MKRYVRAAIRDISEESWKFKQSLAIDPETSPRDLARLAADPDPAIRKFAARNAYTPVDVLRKLAQDSYYVVRLEVLQNDSTPYDIKQHISKHLDDSSGVVEFTFYIDVPLTNDLRSFLSASLDQIVSKAGCTKYMEKIAQDVDPQNFGDIGTYYVFQCGPFKSTYDADEAVGWPFEDLINAKLDDPWIDVNTEMLLKSEG